MYIQKENRKDVHVKCVCSRVEKKYLEVCAKKAGQTLSRYLYSMILMNNAGRQKVIPPEAQTAMLQLMRVAALLHPFSRKRLDGEDFNALERAEAKEVIRQVQALIKQIKNLIP